jgi:hypothetical protein
LKRELPSLSKKLWKEKLKGYREKQDCCNRETAARIFEHVVLKRKGRLGMKTREYYIENRSCFDESQRRCFQGDLQQRVEKKLGAMLREEVVERSDLSMHNQVRDKIARTLKGGSCEVRCACGGFADVISTHWIVEVKHAHEWRHGIGQILAYASDPRHSGKKKRLHLIGDLPEEEAVQRVCRLYGIKVTIGSERTSRRTKKTG